MCCCSSALQDIILHLWFIVSRVALFINIVAALIRKPNRSNAMKEINGRFMRKMASLKNLLFFSNIELTLITLSDIMYNVVLTPG